MLPEETIKARLAAARALREVDQADLNRRANAEGLNKGDAGRIERGELQMRRAQRDVLARLLEVPTWWFTEEEIVFPADVPQDELAKTNKRLDDIVERLMAIERAVGTLGIALRDASRGTASGLASGLDSADEAASEERDEEESSDDDDAADAR